MPLDELQKEVLRVLLKNRSPASSFAGGSVLNRHAYRLSDDHDIFHSGSADLMAIVEQDLKLLHEAGMSAKVTRLYAGFIEVVIGRTTRGTTRVQWVQTSEWMYYEPVPDPDYGWRLHMADIAVNKVLAAADRREVRDYVDLMLIHRNILPLWHALWAAPGKDEAWSPSSVLERISMGNNFRQVEIDTEIVSTIAISAVEVGQTIRTALDEARSLFPRLPKKLAGRLFIGPDGLPLRTPEAVLDRGENLLPTIIALETKRGGAWPSSLEADRAMIERIIGAYGYDGEKRP